MGAALVLNATYEPLCVVPLRRAVVLVLTEKAVVVESGPLVMHSERLVLPIPSVVRLSRFVRVPYRRGVPLTRRAVLERDGHRCAYCPAKADTIDHVRPRSRGGLHVWTNVVAACARCNHRKGDRLLADIGWTLRTPPVEPPASVAAVMGWTSKEPAWAPYLGLGGGRAASFGDPFGDPYGNPYGDPYGDDAPAIAPAV